uniref:Uncharacterized protein n=1 Tax=Panagrolaimus davidi TaxID=227884 RepID=A0A914QI07_9BILA
MSLKSTQIQTFNIAHAKTKVKFSENIEMDFVPIDARNRSRTVNYGESVNYFIENVKGDFEILKLEHADVVNTRVLYSNDSKIFYTDLPLKDRTFELHIMANVDFQPVVSITRRLQIPKERFEYLEPNQMFIDYIVLSNSSKNVSYKFYGKKIDKENIEIHIENPTSTGVKLNGKTGDFHYTTKLQDIDLMLSFIFEIPHSDEQTSVECESRPESISSTAALDFLNEKPSQVSTAIVQNELDLFCFADEWDISSLIEASNHKCQENIDESNVCKTIELAFEKDSVGTKNACKKFILENKAKISTAELGKLSQEILSYVFCL